MTSHGPIARQVLIAGVSALVTVGAVSLYIHDRLSEYRAYSESQMREIETEFVSRAESADRTEATKESLEVVADCSARSEFDALLSRLQSLSRTERERLTALYGDCADYFYRVKLYHIDALALLANAYTIHLTHREHIFAPDERHSKMREAMETILREERVRANAMREQIAVQRDVIDRLAIGPLSEYDLTERIQRISVTLLEADAASDRARETLRE